MFFFREKQSPRSKELTDRYTSISADKSNQIQFKDDLFALVKDISDYLKEADQKEKFVKVFCKCLDQILGDLNDLRGYLSDKDTFSEFINFITVLVSVKSPFNPQLQNFINLLEILEKCQDESINQIFRVFFNNENWIQFIEYNNYFPGISKFNDQSLVHRNSLILDSLAQQIKNYNKKSIQSYVEVLSRLSEQIPKELRYPYSNLLYNIFILNDDYFSTFRKKSGFDILVKLFKNNDESTDDELKSGNQMSDFFCLFKYKEFYKFLHDTIIEDEPKINGQDDETEENLNERSLIEKYSFKLACLNILSSILDQINPETFELTKDQMISLGQIQLMDNSDPSFNAKVEGSELLQKIKDHYANAFARLMTQLRTKIWKKDSVEIDNVVLKDFWYTEDGMNYFINIRNPSFLDYHSEYFKKFDNWEAVYDRMEKSDALVSLFILIFSLPKENEFQTEENANYLTHIYDIYESRNDLFDKIIKRIIKLSFSHFLFLLKNSPNDEIFNEITILSFDNCYTKYDLSLYSIFLKFSLQFNQKLFVLDNFKQMLNIYNIENPSEKQLDYLSLLLLDPKIIGSEIPEIISLSSDLISKHQFSQASCIDRLIFHILQDVDLDSENSLKLLTRFEPSQDFLPLYMSTNPKSTYLNDLFLCNEKYHFDYFTALNILPRTYVNKLFFESNITQNNINPSILSAALQLWPFMYNQKDNNENDENNESFKNFNEINQNLLKNTKSNYYQQAFDFSLLILCLLHFNRVLSEEDYHSLFDYFTTKLRNDQNKDFWFSLLFSSHKISTSFLPLPFQEKDYQLNVPNNNDSEPPEYSLEMPTFESYEFNNELKMNLPCLVPFSGDNYCINEESSTNSNDSTFNEINKQTIHPNKEFIDDENTILDLTNWQTFIGTLLLISDQIDSKKQDEKEKKKHKNIEFIHIYLLKTMIDVLFNNNTSKFKVNSNFLKAAFFGNPYEDLSEIQVTLQIFIEFFTKQTTFNKVVFDFFLDCAIDGWFCEKIGVILNSLFKYYGQFKKKATSKMLAAYKLGFYNVTLDELSIFLCLMKEFEPLFFSIFKREDYFFYHNHINEFIKKAEDEKEKNPSKSNKYDSIIAKCRYTINLINRKYHEIILRNKKKPQKKKATANNNDNDNKETKQETNDENKNDNNDNDNKEVKKETNDENKNDNNNDNDNKEVKKETNDENNNDDDNKEVKKETNDENNNDNNNDNDDEANKENKDETKLETNEEGNKENNEETKPETTEEAGKENTNDNNNNDDDEVNKENKDEEKQETNEENKEEGKENNEETKPETTEEASKENTNDNNNDEENKETNAEEADKENNNNNEANKENKDEEKQETKEDKKEEEENKETNAEEADKENDNNNNDEANKEPNEDKKEEENKEENTEEADKENDNNNDNEASKENNEEVTQETNEDKKEEENKETNAEEADKGNDNNNDEANKEPNEDKKEEENKEEADKENNNDEANKENNDETKQEASEESNQGNSNHDNQSKPEDTNQANEETNENDQNEPDHDSNKEEEEKKEEEDEPHNEEEEKDLDDNISSPINSNTFSIDEFSDADDDEFEKYEKSKKDKYEKSLNDIRKSHENDIRKFRVDHKRVFDTKILTLMNFVYEEVKTSEMTGENYRKIWIDSNKFDYNLLLRKAEYEFGDILKTRIGITENCLKKDKNLIFSTIEILTGIGSNKSRIIPLKLNNIEGVCFIGENKIVFVQGLRIDGEFDDGVIDDSDDNDVKEIIKKSHRFEGHILFEIIRKDISNMKASKNIAKFKYDNINIVLEDPAENAEKLSKILS